MNNFAHDTVVPYRESSRSKKEQVAEMFDDIAVRYDFLNRFLSGGIDLFWRKRALSHLKGTKPSNILDVATGTGDMAILATRFYKEATVTGIDISEGMLEIARKKINKAGLDHKVKVLSGDSEAINFQADTFDAVTVAFGVRNFEDLEKGLSEIRRVLKPGGKLVVLEFSKPCKPVVKALYGIYMKVVTPRVGKFISKNRDAYSYLDESIKQFPEGKNFTHILDNVGFKQTFSKTLTLGICSIYCGVK